MTVQRQSLLIVDDEATNLDILTEALEADYTVRVATDGPVALHSVSKARPDLVLLDVMMPGMDGFEVCRRVKGNPATRDIPIIFITALAQEAIEERGLALGAVDYVTKPFNPSLVRARVRNHMDLKAHRDQLAALVAERTRELEWACFRLSEELAERKGAEESLRKKEATLRGILDATKESIWQFSPDGVVLMANNTAVRRHGGPAEDIVGKGLLELFPTEPARLRLAQLRKAVESKSPVEFEDQLEGALFHHTLCPVLDERGAVTGVASFSRDITEQRRAGDALRTSLEEKTVLLREVHHRVKNNLQIVVSLLSLQANRIHNQEALDMLLDTRNRVFSMALLHETLYRSEGLARIELRSYIDRLTEQIVKSHGRYSSRVKLGNRATDIGLPLDQAIPCGLIINELVSNALKHAFPGDQAGAITVELDRSPHHMLLLRVRDDGVGLPPDVNPEQISTLGLNLVHRLARQLGGELKVERVQGPGACFSVVFPVPEDRAIEWER